MVNHTTRWYARLHPSVVCFTYVGFVFFGGLWNWVLRGATNTFIAASISAGLMLIPSLLCLTSRRNRSLGLIGVYLGLTLTAIICCVYSWRGYVAFVEQSNTPKALLIATQVLFGIITCALLFINRHYGSHPLPTE